MEFYSLTLVLVHTKASTKKPLDGRQDAREAWGKALLITLIQSLLEPI